MSITEIPASKDSSPSSHSGSRTATSLIQGLHINDPASWRQFVHLYGPLIFHFCRRLNLQGEDARDLTQDVFVKVAKSIGRFQPTKGRGSFRGWLRTITRNAAIDRLRRQQAEQAADGGTMAQLKMLEIPDECVSDSGEDQQELSQLYQRGLDVVKAEFEDHTWAAFWQTAVEGDNATQVAADLGMTPGNVRQAKSRVLRRLRQVLGESPD